MTDTLLPNYLEPGSKNMLGTFTFEADEIIAFAKKYDPQVFHVDPVAAEDSLFGALCASGWHTISVWMKLQRAYAENQIAGLKEKGMAVPEFGPSPGLRVIKWPRPVFAGDRVSYFTEIVEIRASKSRPEWHIMVQNCGGINQSSQDVLSFKSSVFIRFG